VVRGTVATCVGTVLVGLVKIVNTVNAAQKMARPAGYARSRLGGMDVIMFKGSNELVAIKGFSNSLSSK
jgi:hypothetical protein